MDNLQDHLQTRVIGVSVGAMEFRVEYYEPGVSPCMVPVNIAWDVEDKGVALEGYPSWEYIDLPGGEMVFHWSFGPECPERVKQWVRDNAQHVYRVVQGCYDLIVNPELFEVKPKG
jgi:hypothetical protein